MQKVAQQQSIENKYDESRSGESRMRKNCEKQKIAECLWNKRAKKLITVNKTRTYQATVCHNWATHTKI